MNKTEREKEKKKMDEMDAFHSIINVLDLKEQSAVLWKKC